MLANTDLSKDQLNKLEIQKQVDLKPIKTMVAKKEIHKFQNVHYSGKQTKDLGGCDKKVMPNALQQGRSSLENGENGYGKVGSGLGIGGVGSGGYGSGSQGGFGNGGQGGVFGSGNGVLIGSGGAGGANGIGQGEPGYEVKADNSYLTNPSRKSTIVVPINRRTGNPNQFRAVDTRANQQSGGRESKKVQSGNRNGEEGSFDEEQGNYKNGNNKMMEGTPAKGSQMN